MSPAPRVCGYELQFIPGTHSIQPILWFPLSVLHGFCWPLLCASPCHFGICLNRTALQILHADSLDAWVDVPVKPAEVQEFGPMVFQQVENARHLACPRIEQGLALTVARCKDVLFESGIILPGQPSRLEAYTAIFDTYLNTNEEKERAMSRSACKAVPQDPEGDDDDELGSNFEELLDLVEGIENTGDPNIKQEKEKLKRKKVQTELKEGWLLAPKRGRGRGRGKGRGRGQGRGRPKGSGKGRGRARGKFQTKVGVKRKASAGGESEPADKAPKNRSNTNSKTTSNKPGWDRCNKQG